MDYNEIIPPHPGGVEMWGQVYFIKINSRCVQGVILKPLVLNYQHNANVIPYVM